MEYLDDLKKAFRNAALICASIMASLPVYLLVVEIIKASQRPFLGLVDVSNILMLRYLFYALAVIQVIIIRVLRGLLLRKPPSASAEELMRRLFKTSILTFALCEVPVLFGLVLFFMRGFYKDFYFLLFVSFFLMFMFFPRYTNWADWLKGSNPSNCYPPCRKAL